MEELKVDQIKSVLNCGFCQQIYKDPIWLPCHESVCKDDINSMKNSNGEIECPFCYEIHIIPEKGFSQDKKTQRLLELEVNKLDFGEAFNKGKNLLRALNDELTKLENLHKNPDLFVDDHFKELAEKIQERKNLLIQMLDEITSSFLDETRKFRNECKEVINNRNEPSNENDYEKVITDTRSKQSEWHNEFDKLALDEQKRDKILRELEQIIPVIKEKLVSYQNKLLKNNIVKLEINNDETTKSLIRAAIGEFKLEQIKTEKRPTEKETEHHQSKKQKAKTPEKKTQAKKVKINENLTQHQNHQGGEKNGKRESISTSSTSHKAAKWLLVATDLNNSLTEEQIINAIDEIMNSEDLTDKSKIFPKSLVTAITSQVESKFPEYHFSKEHKSLVSKILNQRIKIDKNLQRSNKMSNRQSSKSSKTEETVEHNDFINSSILEEMYEEIQEENN